MRRVLESTKEDTKEDTKEEMNLQIIGELLANFNEYKGVFYLS